MKTIVHFQRNGPRDNIYLSNVRLLEELLSFLAKNLNSFAAREEILILAESKELGDIIKKTVNISPLIVNQSMHHLDEPALCDWAGELVTMASKKFHGVPVLLLSPFAGQVSASRVHSFLQKSKSNQALSLDLVGANTNPYWLNLVSPFSRSGDWIRDRNTTKLPYFFNKDAPFVELDELQKYVGNVNIYGSQWLPPIYREDRAIMLYCDEKHWEHVVAECGDEKLPLLYSLPVNDIALDESLTLSSWEAEK